MASKSLKDPEKPSETWAKRGGKGTSSSSESDSEESFGESEAEPTPRGTRRIVQPQGSERRRSLNAWMQARSAQRGTHAKRATNVGAVSHALFNKDNQERNKKGLRRP